jgi:ClpP class serine protease
MNFPLAKEIYGQPWSIDSVSLMHLSSILKNIQNGVALDNPDSKLNSVSLLEIKGDTRIIQESYELNNSSEFEGIGIINLNGPITKNGGASSYGTKDLSSRMLKMANDNRIKGFIVKADSGGGATGAVQLMVDTINQVKATKPVYALVEKGGMAGSACYGIISACTEIYSEDGMNIVGSVGTMIQFSGKPHGNVDQDGEKTVVLYATKSTSKNKAFEEALNNDNYDMIVNELLDPINENFISSVLSNRPQLAGSKFDNGHTVFSKDAVGTFIDGIASFDEVVNKILSNNTIKNTPSKQKSNIKSNSNTMTKQEFKQEHPSVYAEIVNEGMAKEKDRVESWMAYSKADPDAVQAGIESGLEITNAQAHKFQAKLATMSMLDDMKQDSASSIVTAETTTELGAISTENQAEIKAAFDFKL